MAAEGEPAPLRVLELPEPQLGEEAVAPLLSFDTRKGHLVQMQFLSDDYDKKSVFEQRKVTSDNHQRAR